MKLDLYEIDEPLYYKKNLLRTLALNDNEQSRLHFLYRVFHSSNRTDEPTKNQLCFWWRTTIHSVDS